MWGCRERTETDNGSILRWLFPLYIEAGSPSEPRALLSAVLANQLFLKMPKSLCVKIWMGASQAEKIALSDPGTPERGSRGLQTDLRPLEDSPCNALRNTEQGPTIRLKKHGKAKFSSGKDGFATIGTCPEPLGSAHRSCQRSWQSPHVNLCSVAGLIHASECVRERVPSTLYPTLKTGSPIPQAGVPD